MANEIEPTAANTPNLCSYDHIVLNSSAGKDSQVMIDVVYHQAKALGIVDRLIIVHCDLGRAEWPGTKELAQQQAEHYGIKFIVVSRPQGNLLQHVRERGMWPSSKQRYCTSDHKRGQVGKVFTQLPGKRILNCLGLRAEESPARAKRTAFSKDTRYSNSKRHVDTWLPIHSMLVGEIWERIRISGVPHHRAYDLGMPRLSCVFCIFTPKSGLLLAGKHNRELLAEYVATEEEIGHSFRHGFKIAEIQEALERGESAGSVEDWRM